MGGKEAAAETLPLLFVLAGHCGGQEGRRDGAGYCGGQEGRRDGAGRPAAG